MYKMIALVLTTLLFAGCATNFTTRTDPDGTKTTQRTLTSLGMGNASNNETVIVGDSLTMKSGATHEGKLSPEELQFLINLLATP